MIGNETRQLTNHLLSPGFDNVILWLEYKIIQKPINPSVPLRRADVNLNNNEKKDLLIYPFDNHGRVSILPGTIHQKRL